jgi:hypothetical protein
MFIFIESVMKKKVFRTAAICFPPAFLFNVAAYLTEVPMKLHTIGILPAMPTNLRYFVIFFMLTIMC